MPRFLPVGKDAEGAAHFLLAALPALGALLTALAITGDLVGRMARNHPWATSASFGCAALAVFLGAVAAFGLREGSDAERRVLYLGLVVLGAALVFTVYAGVATWGDRPQPSITVAPKRGAVVAVAVHGTGLRSRDHLVVEVEQLLRATDERGRLTWKAGQVLYGASLGPDSAGNVDESVDVPLPAGDFDDVGARVWLGDEPKDCYVNGNTTGCVRVHVPRLPERPQLAVDWETFVRAPRVLIRLKARNLPQRPARSMTLRVYGLTPAQPERVLAEWSLAPDADGVFDRRLSVVVGHAYSDVCVVASITKAKPVCPAPVEDGTVWTQLAVPATT
jgi:hypothetical protein